MVSRKTLEISQNELRKPKEEQTDGFLPFFPHLILITDLYITQLRIPLKSLREIKTAD